MPLEHIIDRADAVASPRCKVAVALTLRAVLLTLLAFDLTSKLWAKSPRTITSFRQLHMLSSEQSRSRYPVRIKAVVTYAPKDKEFFWSQDETEGGFAKFPNPHLRLAVVPGQVVVIEGFSDPGKFGPCISIAQLKTVGFGKVPRPLRVSFTRLLSGAEAGRRVEVSGQLLSLKTSGTQTKMFMMLEGTRVPVVMDMAPAQKPETLIDAEVRLNAVSGISANGKRQFTGITLYVASPDDLLVVAPGSANVQLTRMAGILRYRPGGGFVSGRVKVEGTVTYHDPTKLMVIEDGTAAVFAQVSEPMGIKVGDWVSVHGYPRARGFTPTLSDARAKFQGVGKPVTPVEITAQAALAGDLDGRVVKIKGQLLDHSYSKAERLLTVRGGNISFVAELKDHTRDHVSGLQDGSDLQLTGVLRVQPASSNTQASLRILLRSGRDISVLKVPSWFTRQHLLVLALALVAVLVCILAWVTILRRQVWKQANKLFEQREREAKLESSHERLVENASDLIFTLETEGRFVSANPACQRFTGMTLAALMQTRFEDLIVPGQRAAYAAWFEQLTNYDETNREFDIETASRFLRTLDLSPHTSDSSGGWLQIEFVGRDITQRKRTETALEQARLAAESANAAKTRFLANMSHEIRTPLNAILGMADLLAQTNLTPEQRMYVSMFQSSGDSLLALLNSILDLTKVESGQLQLERIPLSPRDLVDSVMKMLGSKADEKGLALHSVADENVPSIVMGDPGRISQILTNLVANAIKFTEWGEVRVTLRATARENSSPEQFDVSFSVQDTGEGIAADKLELIFERFNQADNSTTRKHGGTGLGLSISRGLARAMGGNIQVSSAPGRGSEFTAVIPFERAPARLTSEAFAPESLSAAFPAFREQPAKILLAEDNEGNRIVIEAFLSGLPVQLDWASNGLIAIEKEAEKHYDLILMDIEMPEMDGYEASMRICERRRLACLPEVPVIALTAHAFEEVRAMCARAGCAELLTKPIRRKVLLATLARYLSSRTSETAVAS